MILNEGAVIMSKIYKKTKLDVLKERSEKRKNNLQLRHMPTEKDILIVSEHTKLIQSAQYETFKEK